jgi:ABC-2 type transport system ATP-binding protein
VPESLKRFEAELIGARRLRLHYRPNQTAVGAILAAIEEAGLEIVDLTTVETDLEDVFLQLTRRPAGTVA